MCPGVLGLWLTHNPASCPFCLGRRSLVPRLFLKFNFPWSFPRSVSSVGRIFKSSLQVLARFPATYQIFSRLQILTRARRKVVCALPFRWRNSRLRLIRRLVYRLTNSRGHSWNFSLKLLRQTLCSFHPVSLLLPFCGFTFPRLGCFKSTLQ